MATIGYPFACFECGATLPHRAKPGHLPLCESCYTKALWMPTPARRIARIYDLPLSPGVCACCEREYSYCVCVPEDSYCASCFQSYCVCPEPDQGMASLATAWGVRDY